MNNQRSVRSRVATGATAVSMAFAAMSAVHAQEITSLNILMPNQEATSSYASFVARELGFYAAEGLEVNFLASSGTSVPYVAFLQNGQADMVMLDSGQVFQAINAGQDLTVVYEIMQFSPDRVSVMADSDIVSLAALKGETIGMASDRDLITVTIALESVGLTVDDVRTVVVGDSGPVLARALRDGDIAAFVGGTNDTAGVEANGVVLRNLTPAEASQNPGNSFVILTSRKDELRAPLEKFLRAYSMGNHAGLLDTKAVAAISKKYRPDQWENLDVGYRLLNTAVYSTTLVRTKNRGELQPDVWARVQPPYVKLGELDALLDPETFLDGYLIAAANDYTTAQVKEALTTWKSANADILLP